MTVGAGARRVGRASAELDREPTPLRARGAPELVDLAVEVLREHFLACVGVCALLYVPVRMLALWLQERAQQFGQGTIDVGEIVGIFSAMIVLPLVIQTFSTAYVTVLAHDRLVGGERGVGDVLGQVLRRFVTLVVAMMLVFALMVAALIVPGLLMFLCPPFVFVIFGLGVFLYWKFSLVPSTIVLERAGVADAIRRSFELTKGSFLRFLGVMALQFFLVVNLGSVVGVVDNPQIPARAWLVELFGGQALAFDAVFLLIASLLQGVSAALTATVITTFYLDARIRREGLDLEMRLARREAELAAEPAS